MLIKQCFITIGAACHRNIQVWEELRRTHLKHSALRKTRPHKGGRHLDSNTWRRELDRVSEMKGMLVLLDPSLEEQVDRKVRHLYDVFAKLSKTENELEDAGFFSKRKVKSKVENTEGNLEEDFMRLIRDFAELFRKTHRDVTGMIPTIQEIKPADAKALSAVSVPAMGAGDFKDAAHLYEFADAFTKKYSSLHQELARDTKELLDENKRFVETYERHITIDRSEVATTVSVDEVSHLPIPDILSLMKKLQVERTYLDGRKDEVSRMLSVSLMSDIESLQASVETATRLGLNLPMDFSQKLRELARDASKATTLTTLLSLESQLETARLQVANMLRDRIINMKHEVTSKIVEGGIPTSSAVIPQAPVFSVDNEDVASLLSSYQKMVEWEGQVKIALKDQVEETLDEVEKAADVPDDTGIKDLSGVRKFVSSSRKELEKSDVDGMIKIYLKAKTIRDEAKQELTDKIRNYLARFNELATSADRVLDYAQLSKKAPKVEDLEGSIVYLVESLNNLRNAVESGVATFRDACKQEVNAIIEDLQTIKPEYAEIFMPIIVNLEDGASTLDKKDDFGALRSEMRTIKDSILAKAKDSLENLRYRLRVKIRLAAAKLMGAGVTIPPDVQEAISELNNIGVAADTVFSLPAIARKMIEIYEKKISSEVIDLLMEEVDDLEQSFEKAESIGVEVTKELDVLRKIKAEPPRDLEAAAEDFDRLANLTTSQDLHKKIRSRVDEAYSQIKDAIHLFEEEGMSEFVARLNTLVEQVPVQLDAESKHINEALDVCLTLANVQEEMLTVIKSIANKDSEEFDSELREKSEYYSTIERVFEKHPKDFSVKIYPLDRMYELEAKLNEALVLDEALKHFNELKKLRKGWVDKAEKMDDWHKSLKMFMAGFSPAESADKRDEFLDDAVRKIRETYSREDISSYLSWAVRVIADTMVKKRG